MLLFRDEEAIKTWRDETKEAQGAIVPLVQVWELSKLWYGNRMSADYRGRTPAEAQAIFVSVGLTSDFWAFG